MYETVADLPEYLQEDLPDGAQEIYVEQYQESWNDYEEEQGGDLDQHGVAHRNAMKAVKDDYIKDKEGTWHLRSEYDTSDEHKGLNESFDIRDTGQADTEGTATDQVDDANIDDVDDAATDEDNNPSTDQEEKPVAG